MEIKELPKILYLGDVPVELSYAGATLLYRLLENYPKDRLMIMQGMEVNPKGKIPGVKYLVVQSKVIDLLRHTRLAKWLNGIHFASQFYLTCNEYKTIKSFKPDIILTVSFRLMWLKAFRLSKHLKIPLHLILHDDWLTTEFYGIYQKNLVKQFEMMYRTSVTRFCISANMEKYYHGLYGVNGNILLPFRGRDDKVYPVSDKRLLQNNLKFCYAGSLSTVDFIPMLNDIAKLIGKNGFELHVYSTISKISLNGYSFLEKPNVFFHKLLPPLELMRIMHKEMDVAILLNSFEQEEAFKYNFSSKLVDYSSVALPVLFWGPASSGVISSVLAIGYEAVITERNPESLKDILSQLKSVEKRKKWATEMSDFGRLLLGYQINYQTFLTSVYKNSL